jgi:hypothetical protein
MNRAATIAATICVAVVGLTGCGGGGSSTPKPTAAPKTFAIEVTPAQVADKLGCGSTFEADSTDEVYVQAVGTCDYQTYGKTRILTFANDTARDSFVTVAEATGGQYIKGHDYAIEYPGG